MGRGYLANVESIPPLIFRFQFAPDMISDKKSFKYSQANRFGQWELDETKAGTGAIGTLKGLLKDVKEISALLVATKPLEPQEGELRTIALDFELDADATGPYDNQKKHGDITPELAVLRSFLYPSWEITSDILPMIVSRKVACWNRPPTCSLKYGGISLTCVVTDLNIKITRFDDKDGAPTRAEVSMTLKEQTYSVSTFIDLIMRNVDVLRSYQPSFLADATEALGIPDKINPFL